MKGFFAIAFGLMGVLTLFALAIAPRPPRDGRTYLRWVIDDAPARREQIALFNSIYPDVQIQIDPSMPDTPSKVIVQSLAGVGPDVFCAYDGYQLLGFVNSGVAMDLTDYLPRMGIDAERELWSAAEMTYKANGRIYGFPANAAADAIWYNKRLFDSAGVPYPPKGPWKWDEFIELAKRMTIRDASGRVTHYGLIFDWGQQWKLFMLQWGARFYTPDGTRCVVDSPEAIAATEFMHSLVFKHRIAPTGNEEAAMATAGGWGSGVITLFAGERAAMVLGGRWFLMLLRQQKELQLGAAEAPHGPNRVFYGYGKSILVNRHSPQREQALKFIEFMSTKPYNDLINAQADALGPVKEYSYTDDFLHNPEHPEEDYNDVWREIMNYTRPEEISPFVNAQQAALRLSKQIDLIKTNQKTPADAMRTLAQQINDMIAESIAKNHELRERYEQLTGRPVAQK
jgi:multiple sugar transport system substrate-binding protein